MARKAKEKKANLLLKQVWQDLREDRWIQELSEARPAGMWTRHGPNIKGRCPWHDDPTPSFVVTPSKGIAKCFGCGKTWLHPVKFDAALRDISFSDALLHLRKTYQLKSSIPESLFEKAVARETHQKYVSMIASLCCDQLAGAIVAYPNLGPEYAWARTTVEWIKNRKLGVKALAEPRAADEEEKKECEADPAGVWAHITANQLVGVLPPLSVVENHFKALGDEEGFAFFRKYFLDYMDQKYVGAIVFVYHDEPNQAGCTVGGLKLRLPLEEKGMYWVEDEYRAEAGDFRGFFGLNYYRTYLCGQLADAHPGATTRPIKYDIVAYIHEGEFDALASIARHISSGEDDFIALCVSGSSAQPLEKLNLYGIERARIVQDNDLGGRNFIELNVERTNTDKIRLEIFNWPDEYVNWRDPQDPKKRIKDPDEAVKVLGYPKWSRYVRSGDNYTELWLWVYERAAEDLNNLTPDRVAERYRAAVAKGRLLKNEVECRQYCVELSKHYEVDQNNLFRDIRAREEGEDGFIRRLGACVKDHFYLVGFERAESRKRVLHVWHKERKTHDAFVLNDEKAIEATFNNYFGSIIDFVREHVGDPAFLAPEGEDAAALSNEFLRARYRGYLNQALMFLSKDLPSVEHAPRRSQGIHYVPGRDGDARAYIVNGKDVYKIGYGEKGMVAALLDGPSEGGLLFENAYNEGEEWLSSVKAPEDLYVEDCNIVELFQTVRDMISTGWAWRHQALDPTFLAAYCLCLPVMSTFNRQTAIMLNAEAQSGKSRFVSGFIGGTGFPTIHMVASAKALQVYTAASIRSQWNNSAMCLCLEEFEDSGGNDKKAVTVRNVLELTRDLISENFVDVSIGTTSGATRKFHLRFPLVCAAIRPLRDAASLSRFVVFELQKDESRIDPVIALLEKYGEDGLAKIRHQVALAMLPNLPRLRQLQRTIEKEFATGASLPAHVPSRFREAMYPVLTMLKFIAEQPGGEKVMDYKSFAWEFAGSRREQLQRLKTTSENEQLFESILSSSFVVDNKDNISRVASIRIMLAQLNELDAINKTKKGVFFDAKNEWLVVDWIGAAQGVLANTRYKLEAPTYLKQVSERSPYHVKTEDARQARVLERLIEVMGPGYTYDMTTVFTVKHLLDAARAQREASKTTPAKAGGGGSESGGTPSAAGGGGGGGGFGGPTGDSLHQDNGDEPVKLDDDMVT